MVESTIGFGILRLDGDQVLTGCHIKSQVTIAADLIGEDLAVDSLTTATGNKGQVGVSNCTDERAVKKCDEGTTSPEGSGSAKKCTSGGGNTCAAGTFLNKETEECAACPFGFYSATEGAVECFRCAEGTFAGQKNAKQCTDCPSDWFTTNTGQANCTRCGDGRVTNAQGLQVSCSICFPGKYEEMGANTRSCTQCPSGAFANVGQQITDRCATFTTGTEAPVRSQQLFYT